jgi:hypothetical protein
MRVAHRRNGEPGMSILGCVQAKFSFRDPFQPSSFTSAVRFALPTSHSSLSKKNARGSPRPIPTGAFKARASTSRNVHGHRERFPGCVGPLGLVALCLTLRGTGRVIRATLASREFGKFPAVRLCAMHRLAESVRTVEVHIRRTGVHLFKNQTCKRRFPLTPALTVIERLVIRHPTIWLQPEGRDSVVCHPVLHAGSSDARPVIKKSSYARATRRHGLFREGLLVPVLDGAESLRDSLAGASGLY